MSNEPQSQRITQGYTDPLTIRLGDATNPPPAQVAEPALSDGAPARLPVDIRNEYERRLCELEERVKALENKLDSVIITLTRMFGNGQAAMQKLK